MLWIIFFRNYRGVSNACDQMFPSMGSFRSEGSPESFGDKGSEAMHSVDSTKGHNYSLRFCHVTWAQTRGPKSPPGTFVVITEHTGGKELTLAECLLYTTCCLLGIFHLTLSVSFEWFHDPHLVNLREINLSGWQRWLMGLQTKPILLQNLALCGSTPAVLNLPPHASLFLWLATIQ